MTSLLRALSNAAVSTVKAAPPVRYVSTRQGGSSLFGHRQTRGMTANLAAMGSVGTLWSIVDLLSSSTAAVQWKLWLPAADGDPENRTEIKSHRVLDLLRRPNPFYTRQLLFETCQQHIELCGEGWIVVVKNVLGWPTQLWPVRPDRMRVVPDPDEFIAGYEYLGPDGEVVPLGIDEVLSIKTPNPYDAYRGLGPVQSILLDAGLIRTATFWNGFPPSPLPAGGR